MAPNVELTIFAAGILLAAAATLLLLKITGSWIASYLVTDQGRLTSSLFDWDWDSSGFGYRGLSAGFTKRTLERIVRKILRETCLLWFSLPCIAMLGVTSTTCRHGFPTWIYMVYFLMLLWNKRTETFCLRMMYRAGEYKLPGGSPVNVASIIKGTFSTHSLPDSLAGLCILGALDHADVFLDHVFPVQAKSCDDETNNAFVQAWNATPWLGHSAKDIVQRLHFWGVALATLV